MNKQHIERNCHCPSSRQYWNSSKFYFDWHQHGCSSSNIIWMTPIDWLNILLTYILELIDLDISNNNRCVNKLTIAFSYFRLKYSINYLQDIKRHLATRKTATEKLTRKWGTEWELLWEGWGRCYDPLAPSWKWAKDPLSLSPFKVKIAQKLSLEAGKRSWICQWLISES